MIRKEAVEIFNTSKLISLFEALKPIQVSCNLHTEKTRYIA